MVECATAAVFEQVVAVAAGLVAAAVVSGVARAGLRTAVGELDT